MSVVAFPWLIVISDKTLAWPTVEKAVFEEVARSSYWFGNKPQRQF